MRTRNLHNLFSALHFFQEGIEISTAGRVDAEESGDRSAAEYFLQTEETCRRSLFRARELLRERREESCARDLVDESSMESFPASDPPASY